jgi:aspartyl-tRNA synthetase
MTADEIKIIDTIQSIKATNLDLRRKNNLSSLKITKNTISDYTDNKLFKNTINPINERAKLPEGKNKYIVPSSKQKTDSYFVNNTDNLINIEDQAYKSSNTEEYPQIKDSFSYCITSNFNKAIDNVKKICSKNKLNLKQVKI